jgi:CubicO group peptidase (beta-lactamase class C family)
VSLSRRSLLAAATAGVTGALLARPARADGPIEAAMDREARRLGHPGVAMAIVPRDAPPIVRGYGVRDLRGRAPVQPDTIFRLASVTKVFSGVALLALRDAGTLSLDDPVARWLPEARGLPAMTLRHLVTHTSGLPRDVPAGGTTEAALLAKLAWVKPVSAPGTRTSYSNLGMALAGPIVRRASGEPYRTWMHDRLLAPLGMTGAGWERAELPDDRLATGNLSVRTAAGARFEPSLTEWRMGAAEAFGGLYASAEDMARFAAFELGRLGAQGPLAPASLRESQSAAIEVQGERLRYGVCWRLEGARVVHAGATDEFSAAVVLEVARGAGAVVLSTAPFPVDVEGAAGRLLDRA